MCTLASLNARLMAVSHLTSAIASSSMYHEVGTPTEAAAQLRPGRHSRT
jgi:hypothetical protein